MPRGQRLALIAAAVAVAAVAFVILRPSDDEDSSEPVARTTESETRPTEPTEPEPAPEPRPSYQRIRVRDGQPVGGVEEIKATKGDTVRIEVDLDAPQEVHLHGYDISKEAGPDDPARFRFDADIEGVFEIELEGPHTQVAELTVEP